MPVLEVVAAHIGAALDSRTVDGRYSPQLL